MKHPEKVSRHIISWINTYLENSKMNGLVVGVSGGVDSALTSTLCAETGKNLICIEMPIKQGNDQVSRSKKHIEWLKSKYPNVSSIMINLDNTYNMFVDSVPKNGSDKNNLSLANTRSRLRMVTLYYFSALHNYIVAGTGNKVEDFGVGFYTKYGDGGVDISPIADCNKTQVWEIGKELGILKEIIDAPPTDGLWDDGRTDEGQLGFKYQDLEDAMVNPDSPHKIEYEKIRKQNLHKMEPIPVCKIPS